MQKSRETLSGFGVFQKGSVEFLEFLLKFFGVFQKGSVEFLEFLLKFLEYSRKVL
jgi:hypothetical protein